MLLSYFYRFCSFAALVQNDKTSLTDFLTIYISTIPKTIKAMFSFLGRHCFFICALPLFVKHENRLCNTLLLRKGNKDHPVSGKPDRGAHRLAPFADTRSLFAAQLTRPQEGNNDSRCKNKLAVKKETKNELLKKNYDCFKFVVYWCFDLCRCTYFKLDGFI
jgi:hypothetical protein